MFIKKFGIHIAYALCIGISIPLFSQTNATYYMNSYANNYWNLIPNISEQYPIASVCGNNLNGIIVCGGSSAQKMWYIDNYAAKNWVSFADAPIPVMGMCGNTPLGVTIYGGPNAQDVYYIDNFTSGQWKKIPKPAPWPIVSICGENRYGVCIAGGQNSAQVAYCSAFVAGNWHIQEYDAPFPIIGLAGDNYYGLACFGGKDRNLVACTHNTHAPWVMLYPAPININYITGDVVHGVIIIGGPSGNECYYMGKFAGERWTRISDIPLTTISGFTGENRYGPIAIGDE